MSIVEDSITIAAGSPLPAFIARPEAEGPHPAVVIIYEIFGLNRQIQGVAQRLAEAGMVGVAPDFFRHAPTPYEDFAAARQVASCLSDTGAIADVGSTLDYLERQPYIRADRIAVLGFCMGGRLAFLAACHHPDRIRACVSFYGARMSGGRVHDGQTMVPLDEAAALTCPVQFFFGEQDAFIPPEEVEAIRDRMDALSESFSIHVYPGADHGFFCEDRAAYHPIAAADAWNRTLEFLGQNLHDH